MYRFNLGHQMRMMAKKEALKGNCYWGEGEKEAALRLKGGYGSAN